MEHFDMKHILKISLLAVISAMIAGCGKDSFDLPDYYTRTASTSLGQSIVDGSGDYIMHVKNDTQTKVADGVTLLEMGILDPDGHAVEFFLYTVALGPASVISVAPESESTAEKLSKMAADVENQGRYTVLGGISAGEPAATSGSFFAILNDGSAICLSAEEYAEYEEKIICEAGGQAHLVENGYVLPQTDVTTQARSAVGVSADGNEVYLLVVDGGDFYYSNGIGCDDLSLLMKGCGASDAIALSSGADVTAVWRNIRSEILFEPLNRPSNKGIEAETAGGLVIVR